MNLKLAGGEVLTAETVELVVMHGAPSVPALKLSLIFAFRAEIPYMNNKSII